MARTGTGAAAAQNAADNAAAADLPNANQDLQNDQNLQNQDLQNDGSATQREARFAPNADNSQANDHILIRGKIDGSYYVLKVLEKLGIVWDVRVPPAHMLTNAIQDN